jgi:hypothetical protein
VNRSRSKFKFELKTNKFVSYKVFRILERIFSAYPDPGYWFCLNLANPTNSEVNPDLTRHDLIRPDLTQPNLIRPDLTQPSLIRPDLTRPDPTRS